MNKKVNGIIARDNALGRLAQEAEECASDGKYMASIACLSILAEQVIKLGLNVTDGNFHNLLRDTKEKGLISQNEFIALDNLRQIRNKIFHESHHAHALTINGIAYILSEDDTKELIYKMYSDKCFEISLNLIKK